MQLGKKITIFNSKPCYMIFELDAVFDLGEYEEETDGETTQEHSTMYNGPIKTFESLFELNNYLSQVEIEERMPDIKEKLYKGHLFPGKEFPLTPSHSDNVTFIIEKVDTTTCFVEQMRSLDEAAQSIKEEIDMLSSNRNEQGDLEPTSINDYMIFHGKHMSLSFYCYDSDV